jgi:hypothetical protein
MGSIAKMSTTGERFTVQRRKKVNLDRGKEGFLEEAESDKSLKI